MERTNLAVENWGSIMHFGKLDQARAYTVNGRVLGSVIEVGDLGV